MGTKVHSAMVTFRGRVHLAMISCYDSAVVFSAGPIANSGGLLHLRPHQHVMGASAWSELTNVGGA